jgi:hypothetical protein
MNNRIARGFAVLVSSLICATGWAVEGTQDRIDSIHAAVWRDFSAGRFEAVNDAAGRMLRERRRLPDGRWELDFVAVSIQQGLAAHDEAAWQARVARTDTWIARTPGDPTPYLAKAQLLLSYAWDARGDDWASTVTDDGWTKFRARVAAARRVLESSAKVGKASPVWFELMQNVALAQSWPEEQYGAMFDEAVRREPTFYPFYFNAAQYFLPRWHGNADDVRRFVDAAVARTKASEGQTLYARIYWSLLFAYEDRTFAPGAADWRRMRTGFEDILRSYPDNWNKGAFAFYACMAGDWPTYRKATRMMSGPEPRIWSFGLSPELCSARADQALDAPRRPDAEASTSSSTRSAFGIASASTAP